MYDKYIIVAEEFKNVEENGEVTGFQFGLRLPYYRGVVLSLVGATKLSVDGEVYPEDKMTVTLGSGTFPKTQLEDEPVARWEFGEIGIVKVTKPGGLEPGEHKVEIDQNMKISYVPGGFWGSDSKELAI